MMTASTLTRSLLLLKRHSVAKKMIGEEGFTFTEELKINIVYLLLVRYDGDIERCSRGVLINKLLLAKWKEELSAYVRELVPRSEDEVDSEDIYLKGMKRLQAVITTSKDPHKITSALKMMKEMEAESKNKEKKSIFDTINTIILGEDIDNED